jgi:hypothetical protein
MCPIPTKIHLDEDVAVPKIFCGSAIVLPKGEYRQMYRDRDGVYFLRADRTVYLLEDGRSIKVEGGIFYNLRDGYWFTMCYQRPVAVAIIWVDPKRDYGSDKGETPAIKGFLTDDLLKELKDEANQSLLPTPMSVTPPARQEVRQP